MAMRVHSRDRVSVSGHSRRALICLVYVALLCLLVFAFMSWQLRLGGLTPFDNAITNWVRSFVHQRLTLWVILITDLGSYGFIAGLTVVIALYLFVYRHLRNDALGVAITTLSAWLLYSALKLIFMRPRPDLPQFDPTGGYSFPSGHATMTTALFFTIALIYCRYADSRPRKMLVLVGAALLALLVGISRVYLGVHYPSDVVAGWALGGFLATVSAILIHLSCNCSAQRFKT